MEQIDQVTMDDEEFKELHAAIENGDVAVVSSLLQEHSEEQYFSYEKRSALFKAYSSQNYEITAYLIHKGAKCYDYESLNLHVTGIDLNHVNYLLFNYNKKSEKSCIYRLISCSQSPQDLDGERLDAIVSMYEDFFKSEIIKSLMMVLEGEAFDIVYDFSSEDVHRMYNLSKRNCKAIGLVSVKLKVIFIGAKALLSGDSRKRAKVYGIVAEELCHLVMTILYENYSKPYRKGDFELKQEFQDIVLAVKSSLRHSCHVETSIKDVITKYRDNQRESELIARVPCVIAIHGEELARIFFLESPELSRLLTFYRKHVYEKCKVYINPMLNTKPHQMMKKLIGKYDFMSSKEKEIQPLNETFPSFREYIWKWEDIYVIPTNCTKLCTLQVYHELKREYKDQLEKKCLFFTTKSFKMDRHEILETLIGIPLDYFILLQDEKELNLRRFSEEYLDCFNEFPTKGMKILLIVSACQSFGSELQYKTVNYNWDDLTEDYKKTHEVIKYHLNGEEKDLFIPMVDFQSTFSEEEIMMMINGDILEVNDGTGLFSEGYIQEIYIEREFQEMTVDKKVFVNIPDNVSIFISGMIREDGNKSLNERFFSLIDEKLIQWLQGPEKDVIIQKDKSIFVIDEGIAMDLRNSEKEDMRIKAFEDFNRKNKWKTNIWLHQKNKEFYLRSSDPQDDFIKHHMKPMIRETEMLEFLQKERVAIISDNAGCGKSTFISSLIRKLKEKTKDSWIWRINLNKFLEGDSYPLFLQTEENSDVEEELNHLLSMIGLKNGLQRHLLRNSKGCCFMFFDGFDEVPQENKPNALKLISLLKEKTDVIMMISTRRHLQEELEELLSTCSLQLVHFPYEAQGKYLEKFWKWNLKFPYGMGALTSQKNKKTVPLKIKKIIEELKNGMGKLQVEYQDLQNRLENIRLDNNLNSMRIEIDKLDFTKIAYDILCKCSLGENISNFLGIPLHLYMIGNIYYNSNFVLEFKSDFFNLFSQFIEQKIQIYLKEKRGLSQDEVIVNKIREGAYRIHSMLANELLNKGTVYLASKMEPEDRMLCSYLGIVSIKDGVVHFLHRTFAEFFIAASLMQNMQEEVFKNMFSNDIYIVVARFVLSALEERKLPKEFFKGVDFFVDIIKVIFGKMKHSLPSNISTLDSDMICLLKIIKKLLENFVEISNKDSEKQFIQKMHQLMIKRYKERIYCQSIGVCLTSSMLKILLKKNCNKYLIALFSFVRYTKSHHEVRDVLEECISKCLFQGKTERGNSHAEGLLKLSDLKDSGQNGLIYYALWNDKSDIFPNLLKHFRVVLGKEKFMKEIIQSFQYKKHMKEFLGKVHQNRFCTLFKELFHVFGNEIQILFDIEDIKVCIISVVVTSNNFSEMRSSLQKCFGDENLKELLLTRDSDGDYSIHKLTSLCSNSMFMTNLNIIREVLNNDGKFNQLLQKENKLKLNIFNLALQRFMHFQKLLQLCFSLLEEDEILRMLLNVNKYGNNVIHSLIRQTSFETLREHLNLIKGKLGAESFQMVLKSKNIHDCNIFHLAVLQYKNLIEILKFCENHLQNPEINIMLLSADKDGQNVLHYCFLYNDSRMLQNSLGLFNTFLGEDERFKDQLKSKTKDSDTILHLAARNEKEIDLSFLKTYLPENEIAALLMVRNKDGCTCLHDATYFDTNMSKLFECAIKNLKDHFEDFIMRKDNCGNTFLHLMCQNLLNYGTIISSIEKHFNVLREKLFDDLFNKLLREKNNKGETFLQTEHKFRNEINEYLKRMIDENLFKELSK